MRSDTSTNTRTTQDQFFFLSNLFFNPGFATVINPPALKSAGSCEVIESGIDHVIPLSFVIIAKGESSSSLVPELPVAMQESFPQEIWRAFALLRFIS